MEKGDNSDNEEVKPEPVVETIPAVKPKKKLNLTPEARAKRAENMRKVSLARIEKSRSLNEIIKKDVDEVKHDVKLKAYKEVKKRVGKIKAEKLNEPEPESDSDDSDDSDYKPSKKKGKSKSPYKIIIKNYTGEKQQKSFDASEQIEKLKDIYREPSPPPQPQPVRIGYFV